MSLFVFQQQFPDEASCLLFLETQRWGDNGANRYCPHCGSLKSYKFADGKLFKDNKGDEWQNETSTEQLPVVLFVCPRMSDLIYAKRQTRGLIAKAWEWEDDDMERPRVRFMTAEKLKQSGFLGKGIWEQA